MILGESPLSDEVNVLAAFEVLSSLPAFLCVTHGGRVAAINKHGSAMLGLRQPAEAVGMEFDSFLAREYRGLGDELLEMIAGEKDGARLKLAKGLSATTDLELSTIMNGRFPPGTHVLYGNDITEKIGSIELLHQRETRYRSIIENASYMICEATDAHITGINAAGLKLLGIEDWQVFKGRPLSDLFLRDYHELFASELATLCAEAAPVPVRLLRTNGTHRDVEVVVTSLDGKIGRHLLLEVRDISVQNKTLQDLRALNEGLEARVYERTRTLREAQERLAQTSKLEAIGTFAGGIAHEINTPIQFLSDNLKFLQSSVDELQSALGMYAGLGPIVDAGQDPCPYIAEVSKALVDYDIDFILEEAPTAISQSMAGISHITKVVQAMRDFADRRDAKLGRLCINKLIAAEITELRRRYSETACIVLEDLAETILVDAAAEEILQALRNLVDNSVQAVRAKNEGFGTITVKLLLSGSTASIVVEDDGVGMSAETLARAFDPFFTTREVGAGIGQGLAIAHHIINDRHKGDISLQSTEGVGTVATVTLPCTVADQKIERFETPPADGR